MNDPKHNDLLRRIEQMEAAADGLVYGLALCAGVLLAAILVYGI